MYQVLCILVINLKEVKTTIQYNQLGPRNKTIKYLLIYSEYQQFQLMLSASFFLQIWCCTGNKHIFIPSQSHQYLRLIILWMQLVYNKHKAKNQFYHLWQTKTSQFERMFSFVSSTDFSWTSNEGHKRSWNNFYLWLWIHSINMVNKAKL